MNASSLLLKKDMNRLRRLNAVLLTAMVSLCVGTGSGFAADGSSPVDELQITHAVILVGGIHETSHYFDGWVPALAAPDTVVLGWDHDHQTTSMKESARLLARRISELSAQGITDVTIVAHSMGGLVAKGAIDELSRRGEAERFAHLEIRAFGTPWGGYAFADMVPFLPGSETISTAIGYPMGPDIGPHSDYMKNLAQPMPANGELHIYLGTADNIARPEGARTKERYKSIEARAVSVMDIEGFNHVAYRTVPADLLNVPGNDAASEYENISFAEQPTTQRSIEKTASTAVVHLELEIFPAIAKVGSR